MAPAGRVAQYSAAMGSSREDRRWLPRFAQSLGRADACGYADHVIQGARQVGKSTLAWQVFAGREGRLLSLDSMAAYEAARADPEAFVRQTPDLLVIDEVQRVPELLRAMKDAVEEDRRPGRFLVTGSANLLDVPGSQGSLAGRAGTVALYGLSRSSGARNAATWRALNIGSPMRPIRRREPSSMPRTIRSRSERLISRYGFATNTASGTWRVAR